MGLHKFTAGPPDDQFSIDLTPPPGATAVIIRAHVKKAPVGNFGDTYRLLHLRLKKPGRPARETQLVELICRNGTFTAGFTGFGGGKKAMENPENRKRLLPQHMGPVAAPEFDVTMTYQFSGEHAVVAAGSKVAESATELASNGAPMELVLGFSGEGDLKPPVGWEISWADDGSAIEWVGATTSTPPGPAPGPVSEPSTAGTDLKADLETVIRKYELIRGIDPLLIAVLKLLALDAGKEVSQK